MSSQFDQFYSKTRRPSYKKGKKIIKPDGIPFVLEDSYEYSVKINFESFVNANTDDATKLLANEILTSLSVLDKLPGKMKDFDATKFKADLNTFFENY